MTERLSSAIVIFRINIVLVISSAILILDRHLNLMDLKRLSAKQ